MSLSIRYYIEARSTKVTDVKESLGPLVISCSYGGVRMKMYLGIKVATHFWDAEKQCVKDSSPDAAALNPYLLHVKEIASSLYPSLQTEQELPDPKTFRETLKKCLPAPHKGFFDAYLEFMEENQQGWAKNTYLKVRSLYSLLRKFEVYCEKKMHLQSFSSFDFQSIGTFFRNKQGFAEITTVKYLSILKWFLNWAVKKKYYFNPSIQTMKSSSQKVTNYSREIIYLNRDELFKLYQLIGLSRKEERIRDIFCFICFTGIRYSVLKQIKKYNLTADYITFPDPLIKKSIPLNQYAKDILKKYTNVYFRGETLFPAFSELTINKYLREIAEKAKLNRSVYINKNNGERKKAEIPVNQIVTIGVARNTFIMNGLLLGVSEESLARMVGRRSPFLLQRYKIQLEMKDISEMNKFNDL